MADYRPPLEDIGFVLDHLVDLEELCELESHQHLDSAGMHDVLESYGRFVAEVVAPLDRTGDLEGASYDPDAAAVTTPTGFRDAYARYVESGWGSVPFPVEYGGGGFPWLIAIAMQEMITSANMSLSMLPLLTQGAIEMLLANADEDQRQTYLPKMVSGEWSGTMNLTEPDAGSDLGAIRTRAVRQDDGTYLVTGTKIFISFGEHDMAENIVHLVLARTPDAPEGTRGISCFIVPKFLVEADGSLGRRNDVRCVSIEHKMGIKASPTCVMSYGDQGGAVGYLIGEENQGMRYMFTMMNSARLSVGVEGLAMAERAYQDAVDYARQRVQGRAVGSQTREPSPIIEHPDVRAMLMSMRSTIEAMRALIYVAAEAMDLAVGHPDPGIREVKQEMVDLLIPLAKAWSTDMGTEIASMAMQVYGGLGYMEESGVPQHLRDVRITQIYEGTNGIQAIDLVGRKLSMREGAAVIDLLSLVASLDPALLRAGDDLAVIRSQLAAALTTLADTTGWIRRNTESHPRDVFAGATPYLRMFSLVIAGWAMARQALTVTRLLDIGDVDGPEADRLRAKLVTAKYFCQHVLPQVHGIADSVTAGGDLLYSVSSDQL